MASTLCIYVTGDDIARHLADSPDAVAEVLSSLAYLLDRESDKARFFKRAVEDVDQPEELLPIVEGLAAALRAAAGSSTDAGQP